MNAPRLLAGRIEAAQKHEAGLPGVDAVHDMRVALRRLRAALRLLELGELDGPVKELQDALGRVRDLQVQREWLSGRPGTRRIEAALRTAERALEPALARWRSKTLPLLLDAARDAKTPGAARRSKILRKRLRRFEERLEAARERPVPRAMHRVRISVKQVRYLFELQKGAAAKLLLAELPPLQESLGQLHDMDVRRRREERRARADLAAVVTAQLERWHDRGIIGRARRKLGHIGGDT